MSKWWWWRIINWKTTTKKKKNSIAIIETSISPTGFMTNWSKQTIWCWKKVFDPSQRLKEYKTLSRACMSDVRRHSIFWGRRKLWKVIFYEASLSFKRFTIQSRDVFMLHQAKHIFFEILKTKHLIGFNVDIQEGGEDLWTFFSLFFEALVLSIVIN